MLSCGSMCAHIHNSVSSCRIDSLFFLLVCLSFFFCSFLSFLRDYASVFTFVFVLASVPISLHLMYSIILRINYWIISSFRLPSLCSTLFYIQFFLLQCQKWFLQRIVWRLAGCYLSIGTLKQYSLHAFSTVLHCQCFTPNWFHLQSGLYQSFAFNWNGTKKRYNSISCINCVIRWM